MKSTNKNKKKYTIITVSIFLILLLIIGGTYAWFISSQTRRSKFTIGEINHEIVENFVPTGAASDILPGDIVNKDVWIHNLGKSDALLRVKINPVWINDKGESTDSANNYVSLVFPNDLSSNWYIGQDGYFYFKKILKSHNSTEDHPTENAISTQNTPSCYSNQLLDAVSLSTTILNQTTFANKAFDVVITSETIQVNKTAYKEQWNTLTDKALDDMISNLVNDYTKNK